MDGVRTRYIPANTRAQHNRARARYKIPPSKNESMAELMVSEQIEKPVLDASHDIAQAARALATAELKTARAGASEYTESIDAAVGAIKVVDGNPRVSGAVTAHGGRSSWGGFKDPESSHAAVVEFGNPSAPNSGRRILGRAGAPWDNPKAAR